MSRFKAAFARVRKAFVGAATAGGAVLTSAITDQSSGGGTVTSHEWRAAAIAAAIGFVGVYLVPNRADGIRDEPPSA